MSLEIVESRNQSVREQIATVVLLLIPSRTIRFVIPPEMRDFLSSQPEFQTAEFKVLYNQWFYAKFAYDEYGFYDRTLQNAYLSAEDKLTDYYKSQKIIQDSAEACRLFLEKSFPEIEDSKPLEFEWQWPSFSSALTKSILFLSTVNAAAAQPFVNKVFGSNSENVTGGTGVGQAKAFAPQTYSAPTKKEDAPEEEKSSKKEKPSVAIDPFAEMINKLKEQVQSQLGAGRKLSELNAAATVDLGKPEDVSSLLLSKDEVRKRFEKSLAGFRRKFSNKELLDRGIAFDLKAFSDVKASLAKYHGFLGNGQIKNQRWAELFLYQAMYQARTAEECAEVNKAFTDFSVYKFPAEIQQALESARETVISYYAISRDGLPARAEPYGAMFFRSTDPVYAEVDTLVKSGNWDGFDLFFLKNPGYIKTLEKAASTRQMDQASDVLAARALSLGEFERGLAFAIQRLLQWSYVDGLVQLLQAATECLKKCVKRSVVQPQEIDIFEKINLLFEHAKKHSELLSPIELDLMPQFSSVLAKARKKVKKFSEEKAQKHIEFRKNLLDLRNQFISLLAQSVAGFAENPAPRARGDLPPVIKILFNKLDEAIRSEGVNWKIVDDYIESRRDLNFSEILVRVGGQNQHAKASYVMAFLAYKEQKYLQALAFMLQAKLQDESNINYDHHFLSLAMLFNEKLREVVLQPGDKSTLDEWLAVQKIIDALIQIERIQDQLSMETTITVAGQGSVPLREHWKKVLAGLKEGKKVCQEKIDAARAKLNKPKVEKKVEPKISGLQENPSPISEKDEQMRISAEKNLANLNKAERTRHVQYWASRGHAPSSLDLAKAHLSKDQNIYDVEYNPELGEKLEKQAKAQTQIPTRLKKAIVDFRKAYLKVYKGKSAAVITSEVVSTESIDTATVVSGTVFLEKYRKNIQEGMRTQPHIIQALEKEAPRSYGASATLALIHALSIENLDVAVMLYAQAYVKNPSMFEGKKGREVVGGFLSVVLLRTKHVLTILGDIKKEENYLQDKNVKALEELHLLKGFMKELYQELKQYNDPQDAEIFAQVEESFKVVEMWETAAQRFREKIETEKQAKAKQPVTTDEALKDVLFELIKFYKTQPISHKGFVSHKEGLFQAGKILPEVMKMGMSVAKPGQNEQEAAEGFNVYLKQHPKVLVKLYEEATKGSSYVSYLLASIRPQPEVLVFAAQAVVTPDKLAKNPFAAFDRFLKLAQQRLDTLKGNASAREEVAQIEKAVKAVREYHEYAKAEIEGKPQSKKSETQKNSKSVPQDDEFLKELRAIQAAMPQKYKARLEVFVTHSQDPIAVGGELQFLYDELSREIHPFLKITLSDSDMQQFKVVQSLLEQLIKAIHLFNKQLQSLKLDPKDPRSTEMTQFSQLVSRAIGDMERTVSRLIKTAEMSRLEGKIAEGNIKILKYIFLLIVIIVGIWQSRRLFNRANQRREENRLEELREAERERERLEAARKEAARLKRLEQTKHEDKLRQLREIKQKLAAIDNKKADVDEKIFATWEPLIQACRIGVNQEEVSPTLLAAVEELEKVVGAYEKAQALMRENQTKYDRLLKLLDTVKQNLDLFKDIPKIMADQKQLHQTELDNLQKCKTTIEQEKAKGWQIKAKEIDKEMIPCKKHIQECDGIIAKHETFVNECHVTTKEKYPIEDIAALEEGVAVLAKMRESLEKVVNENQAALEAKAVAEKEATEKQRAAERAQRAQYLEQFDRKFAKSSAVANELIQKIATHLSEVRGQNVPVEMFIQFEEICETFTEKCFEVVRLLTIPHEGMSLDALKLHIAECAAADERLNENHPEHIAVAKGYAELQVYVAERERKEAARRRAEQNIINNNNVEETPATEESTVAARELKKVISVRSMNVEFGRDLKPHELIKKQREEEREQNLGWMEVPVMQLLYRLAESVNDTSADYQFYPLLGQYSLLYRLHELQLFLLTAFHYHHKDKTGEKDLVPIPFLFQSEAVGGFATAFWNLLMHSYHKVTRKGLLECVQKAYCVTGKKIKDKDMYDPKMLDEKVQDVVGSTPLFQDLSEGEKDQQHHSITGVLKALELAFKHLVEIEKFALKDHSHKLLPHYQESCRMLIMIIGELDQQLRLVEKSEAVFGNKMFQGHLAKYLEKCHKAVRNPLRHGRTQEEYKEYKRLEELLQEVKNAKNEKNYKVLSEKLKEAEELQERIYRRFKDVYEDAKAGRSICMDVMSVDEVAALVDEGRKIYKDNPKLFENIQGTMKKWLKKHGGKELVAVAQKLANK